MKTMRTAAVIALGLLALPGSTQVSTGQDGMLMRIKWVKGKSYSYALSATFNSPQMKQPMTSRSSYDMAVKAVQGGTATVEIKGQPFSMQGMGQSQTVGESSVRTLKVTNQGKVSTGGGAEAFVLLPVKRLKVGDTWESKQKMTSPMGPIDVTTKFRLAGTATLGGVKVAEIKVGLNGGGSGLSSSGHGSIFVNMADGLLQQSSLKQSMRVTNPNSKEPMVIQNDMAVRRVKG
jgi:hypothetical protein